MLVHFNADKFLVTEDSINTAWPLVNAVFIGMIAVARLSSPAVCYSPSHIDLLYNVIFRNTSPTLNEDCL
jgi:hypothetical protein